jgi:pimeloyl-ACP methyl ester carboxylesterase
VNRVRNGATEIVYGTFGSPSDPAILLIMGLAAQMIAWDERFCRILAEQGFFVVRFDNRDVGLSSRTPGPPPDVVALFMKAMAGEDIGEVPYTLSDMAGDALAVLDGLGIERAHIVGASMGGMIAQVLTLEHSDRVRSLTSIMSTTGASDVGQPDPTVMGSLFAPVPTSREEAIEAGMNVGRLIAGPLFDEALARQYVTAAYDRAFNPDGFAFQIAAIGRAADRTEALGAITTPTLVIHGKADRLVTPSGGEATAAAIPGAKLLLVDEMGHDLPEPLWPTITGAIISHVREADATAGSRH